MYNICITGTGQPWNKLSPTNAVLSHPPPSTESPWDCFSCVLFASTDTLKKASLKLTVNFSPFFIHRNFIFNPLDFQRFFLNGSGRPSVFQPNFRKGVSSSRKFSFAPFNSWLVQKAMPNQWGRNQPICIVIYILKKQVIIRSMVYRIRI